MNDLLGGCCWGTEFNAERWGEANEKLVVDVLDGEWWERSVVNMINKTNY